MDQSDEKDFDALQEAARAVSRDWPANKASMALRAVGLDGDVRPSLDEIAAENGVSRETVRRARNQLLKELDAGAQRLGIYSAQSLAGADSAFTDGAPATLRALRRFLTMTGPLEWDQVLTAWARAAGKPPYEPLPTDVVSMQEWLQSAGGFSITADSSASGSPVIDVSHPEALDRVGRFLTATLCEHPDGVDRADLLAAAEAAGLKSTTIATALSQHPAVLRLGRGTWALRRRANGDDPPARVSMARRKPERMRPTSFGWDADGSLSIEFSLPRNPSPVIAVPKAIAHLIEGRQFQIGEANRRMKIVVGNARLWGFGPIVSEREITGGQRVRISLNLISGTARLETAGRENGI